MWYCRVLARKKKKEGGGQGTVALVQTWDGKGLLANKDIISYLKTMW